MKNKLATLLLIPSLCLALGVTGRADNPPNQNPPNTPACTVLGAVVTVATTTTLASEVTPPVAAVLGSVAGSASKDLCNAAVADLQKRKNQ